MAAAAALVRGASCSRSALLDCTRLAPAYERQHASDPHRPYMGEDLIVVAESTYTEQSCKAKLETIRNNDNDARILDGIFSSSGRVIA